MLLKPRFLIDFLGLDPRTSRRLAMPHRPAFPGEKRSNRGGRHSRAGNPHALPQPYRVPPAKLDLRFRLRRSDRADWLVAGYFYDRVTAPALRALEGHQSTTRRPRV